MLKKNLVFKTSDVISISKINILKDLPLSGSISLRKISISMSTDTNGP